MKDSEDLVCMRITMKLLRLHRIFPPKSALKTINIAFYVKASFLLVYCSIILIGSSLHLAKTMTDGSYNHIELDLIYIASMLSAYLSIISFLGRISSLIRLCDFFSDFEIFGKPADFDAVNETYSKYSTLQYANWVGMTIFVVLRSEVFSGRQQRQCKEDNAKYGYEEICGLHTYAWLPFNIDFFPVKQFYIFSQFFAMIYMYVTTGIIAWAVLESVEHISVRLRHVSQCFVEALDESDPTSRRTKFNFSVKYHIEVLRLEVLLNEAFSVFMLSHMVVTGIILGTGAYGYVKMGSAATSTVAAGWMFGLMMDCRSGQRIQDESLKVGTDLIEANWISCDSQMKRDIIFVIMRCRRPILLKAASFGVMNHAMFLAVLKASYTYVNLLSQSGE